MQFQRLRYKARSRRTGRRLHGVGRTFFVLLSICSACMGARAQQFLPDAPEPSAELVSIADPGQSFPPAAPNPPKSTLSPRPPFPSAQPVCVDVESKSSSVPPMSCRPTYDPFEKFI